MSLPLLLVVKQHWDSDMEIVSQETNKTVAEAKAQILYIERCCYQVQVIEVDKKLKENDEMLTVILEIKSLCKHEQQQRVFDFNRKRTELICECCKRNLLKTRDLFDESITDSLTTENRKDSEQACVKA